MTKALAIALAVAALGCSALYLLYDAADAKHKAALAENTRLSEILIAKETALEDLKTDIKVQNDALAVRDKTINELNAATYDAAAEIGRATNESSLCDIDAPLPDSLVRPLRVLYDSQTNNSDGPAGNTGNNPGIALSTPSDAQKTGRPNDGSQTQ
jgi:hypothetical protein